MTSFMKGMTFTMGGNEYEILSEGTSDPSSCLVYAPLQKREAGSQQTLRIWKAEAKLARGEITISGYADEESQKRYRDDLYPPAADPLAQIAELKKRIMAIEQRRLNLLKVDDPRGQILLQDNVVKPNKTFDIWKYTITSGDYIKKAKPIQYVKIRGVIIAISGNSQYLERFLFNISDQLQPCCRNMGNALFSEGRIKIDLNHEIQTVQGNKTHIFNESLGGGIELGIDIKLSCMHETGETRVNANIVKAAYIRDVNAPGIQINKIAFPEIGEHMIAIEGVCLDVYVAGQDKEENIFQ